MSEWVLQELGVHFTVKHGFSFLGEFFVDSPTPYFLMTPGNFRIGGGFQFGKPKYYGGGVPNDYILKPGSITVTMTDLSKATDTLGYPAEVPADGRTWLHNQRVGLLEFKDLNQSFPRFFLYLLRKHEYRSWVIGSATGTTVKHTSPGRITSFSIPVPPLLTQKAIAHILGTLDDKIELLRQMNETLEALARALFKSWFVDFEPVHKKAAGLPTGLPKEIDELFPSEFEDSELGEIPRGWKVGSVLEVAELLSGGTPKTNVSRYWDGVIAWASAKDVSQSSDAFLISTERRITEAGVQESSTKIIPANSTVVVSRGATTGRIVLLGSSMAMNQTCYALHSKKGADFWLYQQLEQVVDRLANGGHGSVFNTITTDTFRSFRVLLPCSQLQTAFDSMTKPVFQSILVNIKSAADIREIRDSLLPKLISGELDLSDEVIGRILEPVK